MRDSDGKYSPSFERVVNFLASSTDLNSPDPNSSGDGAGSGGGSGSKPVVIDRAEVLKQVWIGGWEANQGRDIDFENDPNNPFISAGNHDFVLQFKSYFSNEFRDIGDRAYSYYTCADLKDDIVAAQPPSPYYVFDTYPGQIVRPLATDVGPPNDNYSSASLISASSVVRNLGDFISNRMQTFKQLTDEVDVPGGEFQGSAASVFKDMLGQFTANLNRVSVELGAADLENKLNASSTEMDKAVSTFFSAYTDWWFGARQDSNKQRQPAGAVLATLNQYNHQNVIANFERFGRDPRLYHLTIKTSTGLDLGSQEFWNQVELEAKQKWSDSLALLDKAANDFIHTLSGSFGSTASVIPQHFSPSPVKTPDPKAVGPTGSGGGSTDPNDIFKNLPGITGSGGVGGGGSGDPNKLISDLVSGGGNSGSYNFPDGNDGPGANGAGGIGNLFTSGPATGGNFDVQDSITGPDGKTVTGPDGLPVMAPSGSTIGPDGSVIGPDGKPVVGSNGKNVKAPRGSKLTLSDAGGIWAPRNSRRVTVRTSLWDRTVSPLRAWWW